MHNLRTRKVHFDDQNTVVILETKKKNTTCEVPAVPVIPPVAENQTMAPSIVTRSMMKTEEKFVKCIKELPHFRENPGVCMKTNSGDFNHMLDIVYRTHNMNFWDLHIDLQKLLWKMYSVIKLSKDDGLLQLLQQMLEINFAN